MPPPPPPPPPAPSASVFDPAPYGNRTTSDPSHEVSQYAPQGHTQTSFPPPPPMPSSPYAPQPTGPQQYAPQPTGPHQYAPQPGDSRSTGRRQYEPQNTGPEAMGPQQTGPQQTGPQQYAPQPAGRPEYAPQGTGPQPSGHQQYAPQPYAPAATGPQVFPQQDPGRQVADRQVAGHQQYAPEAPAHSSRVADEPAPAYTPPGTETTVRVSAPSSPEQPRGRRGQRHAAPPREPDDPYKPFVTAGQISGPKTPPPERQQELWNTVFGDNYEAIGDEAEAAGGGKRVWLFALVASVGVALVAALLWAVLAGPLRSAPAETEASKGKGTPKASTSSAGKAGTGTTKPQSIGRLPRYPGDASPRAGVLTDKVSAISLARLGGPWRLDLDTQRVQSTYGFSTRQYVAAGTDAAGTPRFAQVMTGPLATALAGKYSASAPGKLTPVISSVAFAARNKFFPPGNKVVKTAEQRLSAGGRPARVVAYQILAGRTKTTLVVGAVSTGAERPVIVYMSVPDSKKELLPDINTIFSSIRPVATAS
ncbi:hypothetical protein GCM10022226_30340 [Sphaerisporangium flaviroseum]|uniref:Uncharacterized protein n=2 Tax=Sphaerisporangium flaviroseum TaxID=509199 RepID=A0ABP7I1M1_9ACTN